MTLDPVALKADLEAIGPQTTAAAAAAAWAAAVSSYAAGVFPASTTVGAAQSALEAALATAFATPAAAPGMEAAFGAFAATVAGGMAGAGFTGTPPPAPVGFATLFAAGPQTDPSAAAQAMAALIHAWMTTGQAALIAPPNTVSPWA